MTETRSEAFHRLAVKRLEAVQDQIRIFGNLSGPSYEWMPDEVLDYFARIRGSLDEALARFQDTKRWRTAQPNPEVHGDEPPDGPHELRASSAAEDDDPTDAPSGEDLPEATASTLARRAHAELSTGRRMKTITEILQETDDREALAEMIAMQREVIERQQQELNRLRGASNDTRSGREGIPTRQAVETSH